MPGVRSSRKHAACVHGCLLCYIGARTIGYFGAKSIGIKLGSEGCKLVDRGVTGQKRKKRITGEEEGCAKGK